MLLLTWLIGAGSVGIAITVAGLERDRGEPGNGAQSVTTQQHEAFTQAHLYEPIAARREFVNLTAAWCMTSLLNERAAPASAAVEAAFAAKGITDLMGDWTRRNPEITRLLGKHGRSGVPLYLWYDGEGAPTVLPQILTPAALLAAVECGPEAAQPRAFLPTTAKE